MFQFWTGLVLWFGHVVCIYVSVFNELKDQSYQWENSTKLQSNGLVVLGPIFSMPCDNQIGFKIYNLFHDLETTTQDIRYQGHPVTAIQDLR